MSAPARIVAPGVTAARSGALLETLPLPTGVPGAGSSPGGADAGAPRRGRPLGNNASRVSGEHGRECARTTSDRIGAHRHVAESDRIGAHQYHRRLYRSLRKRLRHAGQAVARPNSNVSKCGRVRVGAHDVEVRRRADGSAYFANVVRCKSVWECPECSARIAAHRAAELRLHVGAHRATGSGCYLITLTTPHHQGDNLKHLRESVSEGWRCVCSGRAWIRWRKRIGYVGTVRSAEATVGPNGWHPHLHVLLFTAAPLEPGLLAELQAWIYERWCHKIVDAGYDKPSPEHGVLITESHQDDYIAKLGLADEVASGAFKQARDGRRSPLAVLADYVRYKRPRDLALWKEWCEGMRGARQLTWSKGLRDRYATERELSDQEVVDADEREPAEVVAVIDPETWDAMVSKRPELQARILDYAEDYGERGVRWILATEPYPEVPF